MLGSPQGRPTQHTATVGATSASSHALRGVWPCKEANAMTTKLGPPVRMFQTSGRFTNYREGDGVGGDERWVSAGACR